MELEQITPGTVCVWCWKEITSDQPTLDVGKGARAHLGCDSRMLGYIEKLGDQTK